MPVRRATAQRPGFPCSDRDAGIWHGFVAGVGAGKAYGFRITGPFDPDRGVRCNPAKLLLDPYARAISGEVRFAAAAPRPRSRRSRRGERLWTPPHHVPRSLVIVDELPVEHGAPAAGHGGTSDTVVYEVHVKGFTATHPDIPEDMRDTYAGLAHEAALAPALASVSPLSNSSRCTSTCPNRSSLTEGSPTTGATTRSATSLRSPAIPLRSAPGRPGGQVAEFQSMVDGLHAAGLEVLLDVVFNHTAEAGEDGPTICFRGLDNPAYYRLDPNEPRRYVDTSGCGNTLNAGDPLTLQLIMDSLRYWLSEMRVDGFRFDLAPTLARQDGGFDHVSAFFDLVVAGPRDLGCEAHPEPWDVGQCDSYDVGRFPPFWREWNGPYRDTVRDFWRSHRASSATSRPGSQVPPTSTPERDAGRRRRST